VARIELRALAHSYSPGGPGAVYALHPFTHVWEDGGAYALLGPSGCGKTTMLNIMSGLVRPSEGRVLLDEADVTDVPTAQRNIAQVFQFPVIYQTMSVYENLAFPLRCRRTGAPEIDRRVKEVAELLGLSRDLARPARRLTAIAKQLVSLGRGLVRSDVAALLMDEPLTVVDPDLKWQLRRKLKEINEQHRATLIYVTHDQNEAMTLADKVVVMNHGRVMQVGTPQDLFENPAHAFVGYFIGSPAMNLIPCTVVDDGLSVGGTRIALPGAHRLEMAGQAKVELGIRPDFVKVCDGPQEGALPVELVHVQDLGTFRILTVDLAGHRIKAKVSVKQPFSRDRLHVKFPPEWTRVYANSVLVQRRGGQS